MLHFENPTSPPQENLEKPPKYLEGHLPIEERETPSVDLSRDLMNSAMMAVQANQVARSSITMPNREHLTMEGELERVSKAQCREASTALLYHLLQSPQFKDRIVKSFLLSSNAGVAGSFSSNTQWDNHVYAVIETQEGTWMAASPANHVSQEGTAGETTSLTRILEANSLAGILDKITQTDGGAWPDASSVESAITNEEYSSPHVISANEKSRFDKLGVTEIGWDFEHGITTNYDQPNDLVITRHNL